MLSELLGKLKRNSGHSGELAAARRAIHSRVFGINGDSPDDLVQRKGLEIYDRMQTDAQIHAALTTKKFAALSRPWRILPASESKSDILAADFCRWALENMDGGIQDALFGVLDALAKGYSISEMNFREVKSGRWKGNITLASIKSKDPSLFGIETDDFLNITGLVRTDSPDGKPERLPPGKFIIYTYMPVYDDPRGRSDLRACYKHWWTKEIILRFFSAYLERFGSPVVKGTYKRGTTRQQQMDLLKVLDSIQQETAVVIPEDVTVDLLEAAFRGEQGFLDAIAYHDRQIAKAILGQTMTQEEGQRTGALALAKVHQDTLTLRLQKLKRDIEETVMRCQVLRALTVLNFPDADTPRFSLGSIEEKDTSAVAGVLERMVRIGTIRPDEAWIRQWMGIPEEGK